MRKIILDVFAADSPELLIKGACDAVNQIDDIVLVLTGEEQFLKNELAKHTYPEGRLELYPAFSVIGSGEKPSEALLTKRDSSLLRSITRLKTDDEAVGLISAGNTGALIAGCAAFLGRLPGVKFPSLAAPIPTASGRYMILLDCGAIVDSRPEQIAEFAMLGSALFGAIYNEDAPRVALLNVGTEKGKGNELAKQAYCVLEKLPINFIGNIEARELTGGRADVAVCDGFAGNMALKSLEGAAMFVLKLMVNNMKSRLEADSDKIPLIVKDALNVIDLSTLKGAVLAGVKKPVIKMHGNSNDKSVPNAVRQLLELVDGGFVGKSMELYNIINNNKENENG